MACYDDHVEGNAKVRDHCYVTGKYEGSAHRDCNINARDCKINVKLNDKFTIEFHNLENCDSHLIMQELDKFNFEISVIPNGL